LAVRYERACSYKGAGSVTILTDMSFWPHRIEQLVMRHQLSSVLHQIAQNRERLGRQQDALIAAFIPMAPQTLINEIQPEWRKLLHNRAEVAFYFRTSSTPQTE
jgi:hypothetical protein